MRQSLASFPCIHLGGKTADLSHLLNVVGSTPASQAALGGRIDNIPSLEGSLELEIPEGTQTGAVFRITDKGIPHLNDYGKGDEYVIVKVLTPTNLSEEEKELLKELERLWRQRIDSESNSL